MSHLMFRMFEMASNQGVGIPGVAVSRWPGGRRASSSITTAGHTLVTGIAIQCGCWNIYYNTMKIGNKKVDLGNDKCHLLTARVTWPHVDKL